MAWLDFGVDLLLKKRTTGKRIQNSYLFLDHRGRISSWFGGTRKFRDRVEVPG